jgi:hypothetical protein
VNLSSKNLADILGVRLPLSVFHALSPPTAKRVDAWPLHSFLEHGDKFPERKKKLSALVGGGRGWIADHPGYGGHRLLTLGGVD